MLNWVSDSIVAFKEWDTTKMETQLLKLANSIPFVNMAFGDMFEAQIRVNELTSKVTEEYKKEGDAIAILTGSIMKNNKALKDSNLSEAESVAIKEENDKIVAKLNEKYPELTKNIDFNKITTEEMNALQKEMNATMLDQIVQTAKAAEAERLLNEIVQNTIKSQQAKNELQQKAATGSGGFLDNINILMTAWDKNDADKNINTATNNYKTLDQTMNQVSNTVKGLGIDIKFIVK